MDNSNAKIVRYANDAMLIAETENDYKGCFYTFNKE